MTRNTTVTTAEGYCGFGAKMLEKAGLCVAAAGMGAGLMYFLDPNRGKARRAMVRVKANHMLKACEEGIARCRKDAANRMAGAGAGMRRALEPAKGMHFNGRLAIPALAGLGAGVAAAVEAFRRH